MLCNLLLINQNQDLQESTYKKIKMQHYVMPRSVTCINLSKNIYFKASGKLGNKEDSKAAVAGEEMSPFISCSPFFTLSHY